MQLSLKRVNLELPEGWFTFALLVIIFLIASTGIVITGLAANLWAIQPIVIVALVLGLALAKSQFSEQVSFGFAFVYGAFLIPAILSRIFFPELGAREAVFELLINSVSWVDTIITGGASYDTSMFVVFMAITCWSMAMLATWTIFRRQLIWEAILPAGFVLFINAYYYRGEVNLAYYMIGYLVASVLLLVATHINRREQYWQNTAKSLRNELKFNVYRTATLAAFLLIVVALLAPTTAANPAVASTWRDFTNDPWGYVRDNFMRSFGNLNNPLPAQGADFYGETLPMGSGQTLTDQPIMQVSVQNPSAAIRWYWRARTFDVYQNGGWSSLAPVEVDFDPNSYTVEIPDFDLVYINGAWVPRPDDYSPLPNQTQLTHLGDDLRVYTFAEVTVSQTAMSNLYAPSQPLWIDRPTRIRGQIDTQTNTIYGFNILRSNDLIPQGETYLALSSISIADETSLRNASSEYPDWVVESYLQLPDTLTERTRNLAAELTANADNPYDKAKAIETWLRTNIAYNLSIQAPPNNAEPIDYFLFESQEGYCNYYTAAMVVMLRSVGVPTRMAVGFSEGLLVTESDIDLGGGVIIPGGETYYRVLQENAHAWPEVYFPGYGWIEFEPTVSESPLNRPATPEGNLLNTPNPLDEEDDLTDETAPLPPEPPADETANDEGGSFDITLPGSIILEIPNWIGQAFGLLLFAGVLIGGGVAALYLLEWYGLSGLNPAQMAYARLLRAMRLLRLPVRETDTPYERADQLHRTIPGGHTALNTITDAYVSDLFSPPNHKPNSGQPLKAWEQLRAWLVRGIFNRPPKEDPRDERWRRVLAQRPTQPQKPTDSPD